MIGLDSQNSNLCQKPNAEDKQDPRLMVVSLHSCGNLIHHGLRSLIMNSSVKAVALIGCCYNLCTERFGETTYEIPALRHPRERAGKASRRCDAHGFPMSERFATYEHSDGKGIRMNITARMMAVQAPENWSDQDCSSFFTRHFYRALLQRIFLDRGFVEMPKPNDTSAGVSPAGCSGGQPIIIGTLSKVCYTSFVAYVRGATAKLLRDSDRRLALEECMKGLTDGDIQAYEKRFHLKRHELCVIWSLMAFSAGVVEASFVVDRWQFLEEQNAVKDCWVQSVFEHRKSPRNFVVVGIKEAGT